MKGSTSTAETLNGSKTPQKKSTKTSKAKSSSSSTNPSVSTFNSDKNPPTASIEPVQSSTTTSSEPTDTLNTTNSPTKKPIISSNKSKKKGRSNNCSFQLNANQIQALLKPFWTLVLQNELKQVRKFLLEYGPSKIDLNHYRSSANSDGTALHLCAQMGFIQMADLLIEQGKIQLNLQNKLGLTALHIACKFKHEQFVAHLLKKPDVLIDIPDNFNRVAFDLAPWQLLNTLIIGPLKNVNSQIHQEEQLCIQRYQKSKHDLHKSIHLNRMHEVKVEDLQSRFELIEFSKLHTTLQQEFVLTQQMQQLQEQLKELDTLYLNLQEELTQEQLFYQDKCLISKQKEMVKQQQTKTILQQVQDQLTQDKINLQKKTLELKDQVGFLESCQLFPQDMDIQKWTLVIVHEMLFKEKQDNQIASLLLREGIVDILERLFIQFPSVYQIQYLAMECICQLLHIKPVDTCRLFFKKNFLHLLTQLLDRFHEDWEFQVLTLRVIYLLICPPRPVVSNTTTITTTRKSSVNNSTTSIPVGSARNAVAVNKKNRKSTFCFNIETLADQLTLEEEQNGPQKQEEDEEEDEEDDDQEDRNLSTDELLLEQEEINNGDNNKKQTQYENMLRTFCHVPSVQQVALRLLKRTVVNPKEEMSTDNAELIGFLVFLLVRYNGLTQQQQVFELCVQWLLSFETYNPTICGYLFGTLSMLTGSFVYPKTNVHQKPIVYYQYQELTNVLNFLHTSQHNNQLRQHLHQLETSTFFINKQMDDQLLDAVKILSILKNQVSSSSSSLSPNNNTLLNCLRWGLKLLRNVVLHDGLVSNTIRQQMLTEQEFCLQSIQQLIRFSLQPQKIKSTCQALDYYYSSSSFEQSVNYNLTIPKMGSSVLFYGVQLVQHVYIERYQESNGQIIDMSEKIMCLLIELLTQCTHFASRLSCREMQEIYQLTEAIALVLTNQENVWYFHDRPQEVDTCCRDLIRLIGRLHDQVQQVDTHIENTLYTTALLSNWIRIYLALFHYQMSISEENELTKQQQQIHRRCRDIGLCEHLQDFATTSKKQQQEEDKDDPLKDHLVKSFQTFIQLVQVFKHKVQCTC